VKETNSILEVSTETNTHIAIRKWLSILYCETNIINTVSAVQNQYSGFYNLCDTVLATNMRYYELNSKNFQMCLYKFCSDWAECHYSAFEEIWVFFSPVAELGTPCLIVSHVLDRNYSSYLFWKWFPSCLVARRIELWYVLCIPLRHCCLCVECGSW
jgi:hypothetical protein